jgi:putative transposase
MLLNSLLTGFWSRCAMQAEIIALRHQLTVLQRNQRPKRLVLDRADPHRQGFRWYWTWKVRHGQPGRPCVPRETRNLIRVMSRENPLWGAPRIHGELMKLGIKISEASVAKYMVRNQKPPSQTWRTFLANHVSQLVSVDFFTVVPRQYSSASETSGTPVAMIASLMLRLEIFRARG